MVYVNLRKLEDCSVILRKTSKREIRKITEWHNRKELNYVTLRKATL